MHRRQPTRKLLFAALALAVAPAGAAPPLDELTLAQRGNAVLAVPIAGAAAAPGVLDVELPDLERGPDAAIVAENVRALAVIYHASVLEELKLFAVADKVVESFQKGSIPIGRDGAGSELDSYRKNAKQRLTELERRNLYAALFGKPAAGGDVQPNREFNTLWLRFLAALDAHQRQAPAGTPDAGPKSASPDSVRKAGRDLARNLGLHGYGAARYAAVELQGQIKQLQRILSSKEVLGAYGAKDMWQVVDRVAQQSLGGAKDSRKYRTMASEGAAVMLFLAKHAALFDSKLDPGDRFTKALNDPQFTPAASAERWLAASGAVAPGAAPAGPALKPGLLCLDAKRRLVRCRVRAAKNGR